MNTIPTENDYTGIKAKIANFTIYKAAQTSSWVVIVSTFLTGLTYLFQSGLDFTSPTYLGIKLGIGLIAIRIWGLALAFLSLFCIVSVLIFKKNHWVIFLLGGVRVGLGISSLIGSIVYRSLHVGYGGPIATTSLGVWMMLIGAALIVGKPNKDYRSAAIPVPKIDTTKRTK